jgi:predicted O-methyltransferase YrrM
MRAECIHPQFSHKLRQIEQDVADVEGLLSPRDVRFLALCAAHPRVDGEILEIGAFRGKSTIVLAKAAELAGQTRVVSCDPLITLANETLESSTSDEVYAQVQTNFRRKGVHRLVEFHHAYSHELAQQWHRPIRMLWLDGDHREAGVKQDIADFTPFLQDRAILLMHDVLNLWDGCSRAYIEYVLRSPHFGQAGVYGNIGWAQFRRDPRDAAPYQAAKERLAAGLAPLLPFQTQRDAALEKIHGWRKLQFKFYRWRAQSHRLPPENWLRAVA